eukprot:TRINITY_DN2416_c0_g1_i1.p1 TRINITY_DN2416_c0_g1~~TRINITY_DN2416_c0_g1_i1.p1  ORF type:complete len:182 (+),score=72.48 TRINITY_DN2416_c0_g1_i1:71-616(+)
MQMDQRASSGSLSREQRLLKGQAASAAPQREGEASPPTSTTSFSACSEYECSVQSEHESAQSGWGEQYAPGEVSLGRAAPQQTVGDNTPWAVVVQLPNGDVEHVEFPMFLTPGSNIILEKSYGNVMGMILSCSPQQQQPPAYAQPPQQRPAYNYTYQQPSPPAPPAQPPAMRVHQHCPYAL